jgi:hypothetical protein
MRPALFGALASKPVVGPYFVGAGANPVPVVTAASADYTVSLPTGLQQNDILLAMLSSDTYSFASSKIEGVWQQIDAHAGNQSLFWVRRGASNPSPLFTVIADCAMSSFCVAYRGCSTVAPFEESIGTSTVRSYFAEESISDGGSLQALPITSSTNASVVLNFLATVITFPVGTDAVGADAGWSNRLDVQAFASGVVEGLSEVHCWAMREIAAASGVARNGVIFSGGAPNFGSYGAQATRNGTAFSLGLL